MSDNYQTAFLEWIEENKVELFKVFDKNLKANKQVNMDIRAVISARDTESRRHNGRYQIEVHISDEPYGRMYVTPGRIFRDYFNSNDITRQKKTDEELFAELNEYCGLWYGYISRMGWELEKTKQTIMPEFFRQEFIIKKSERGN